MATDENFHRMAERLASGVHSRRASEAASLAWKAAKEAVHRRAGWRRFREGEREEFVGRLVAKALDDTEARSRIVAEIERQLRERAVSDRHPGDTAR